MQKDRGEREIFKDNKQIKRSTKKASGNAKNRQKQEKNEKK